MKIQNLKTLAIILIGFSIFSSCKKDDDSNETISCVKSGEKYSDTHGTSLNLDRQTWYLNKNALGGINVGVTIEGSIQGDSATIRTYGDGVIYDTEIKLNAKKEFDQNTNIFFTVAPPHQEYISAHSLIMVFSGKDTLKQEINSCPLKNIAHTED
jgi:hypothetical protein